MHPQVKRRRRRRAAHHLIIARRDIQEVQIEGRLRIMIVTCGTSQVKRTSRIQHGTCSNILQLHPELTVAVRIYVCSIEVRRIAEMPYHTIACTTTPV